MQWTLEPLYYAVPLIAVPQTPEQGANADRAEALGLGRRLDSPTPSPRNCCAKLWKRSPTTR